MSTDEHGDRTGRRLDLGATSPRPYRVGTVRLVAFKGFL